MLDIVVLMVRKPLMPVRGMRGGLRVFHHLRPAYLSRRLGFRRLNCPNPWRRFADTTVEVSDITDGASGYLGEKIPCPPTQKQAKHEGDEGTLEGVTLHPIYKTLALVQKNGPSSGGVSSAKPSVVAVDNQTSLANRYLCAIAGGGA